MMGSSRQQIIRMWVHSNRRELTMRQVPMDGLAVVGAVGKQVQVLLQAANHRLTLAEGELMQAERERPAGEHHVSLAIAQATSAALLIEAAARRLEAEVGSDLAEPVLIRKRPAPSQAPGQAVA